MKVLVPVKRVIDYNVKIRVKSDQSGVETENVKMAMNPFDEVAIEEALRMREAGVATEVVAISIGTEKSQETLRTALAMGADEAVLIKTDAAVEPLGVAKLLKKAVDDMGPGVVILGKQAIDDDSNQTGQMLAAMLDWPQGTFASKAEFSDGSVALSRETDDGIETLNLSLPAVITTDLRLNEPRYPNLPNIMKAKKKPLEVIEADSMGVDFAPRLNVVKVEEPSEREPGIIVGSVEELIEKLRNVEKVIS
ncbi:MAG: electron transfer flavoprotein beta subunit [Saprospiraceae bacterium]|jgi:electron transfer flavoprotein beta subunit